MKIIKESADREILRNIHDNLSDELHRAYMTASEMIMYCEDAQQDTYEELAEKILDIKYEFKELQRRI